MTVTRRDKELRTSWHSGGEATRKTAGFNDEGQARGARGRGRPQRRVGVHAGGRGLPARPCGCQPRLPEHRLVGRDDGAHPRGARHALEQSYLLRADGRAYQRWAGAHSSTRATRSRRAPRTLMAVRCARPRPRLRQRHAVRGGRLGRPADQRKALLRALTTECIRHGAITTTLTKCKEVRKTVDHMVTLAKDGSLHARRQALGYIYDKQLVHALFEGVRRSAQACSRRAAMWHCLQRLAERCSGMHARIVARTSRPRRAHLIPCAPHAAVRRRRTATRTGKAAIPASRGAISGAATTRRWALSSSSKCVIAQSKDERSHGCPDWAPSSPAGRRRQCEGDARLQPLECERCRHTACRHSRLTAAVIDGHCTVSVRT